MSYTEEWIVTDTSNIIIRSTPLANMKNQRFIMGEQPKETISHCYSRFANPPNWILNGGMFGTESGNSCFNVIVDGKVHSANPLYKFGIGLTWDDKFTYSSVDWTPFKGFVSAYPVLIDNGQRVDMSWARDVDYPAERRAVGFNDTHFFWLTCFRTREDVAHKRKYGIRFNDMVELFLERGVKFAVNWDGGGSVHELHKGVPIFDKFQRQCDTFFAFDLIDDTCVLIEHEKEGDSMKKILIALDDGHGTNTAGKRTPTFPDGSVMRENEFNAPVVDYADAHLRRCGFDTVLVAGGTADDSDVALSTRVALANNSPLKNAHNRPADLYVSVHANAYDGAWGEADETAQGISVHVQKGLSTTGTTYKYAEIMRKWLLKGSNLRDRNIVFQDLYVTRETSMPALLLECGFMDNIRDAEKLRSDSYRRECAEEIARAICEMFGVTWVHENETEDKPTEQPTESEHWAKSAWQYLNDNGVKIHEQRFDDSITRGEVFSLLERMMTVE